MQLKVGNRIKLLNNGLYTKELYGWNGEMNLLLTNKNFKIIDILEETISGYLLKIEGCPANRFTNFGWTLHKKDIKIVNQYPFIDED